MEGVQSNLSSFLSSLFSPILYPSALYPFHPRRRKACLSCLSLASSEIFCCPGILIFRQVIGIPLADLSSYSCCFIAALTKKEIRSSDSETDSFPGLSNSNIKATEPLRILNPIIQVACISNDQPSQLTTLNPDTGDCRASRASASSARRQVALAHTQGLHGRTKAAYGQDAPGSKSVPPKRPDGFSWGCDPPRPCADLAHCELCCPAVSRFE